MLNKTKVPVTREVASTSTQLRGPWAGFGSLRDEMERLFDAFEPRLWFDRGPSLVRGEGGEIALCPAVDLSENGKNYVVTTELPGLEPDQIDVKLSDGMLTIHGEKAEDEREDTETYHLRERRWGSFQRSIRLPDNIDRDKVDAQFSKGVLTITMPKSEAALASERTVAVKAA